jgi:hypothetical protein
LEEHIMAPAIQLIVERVVVCYEQRKDHILCGEWHCIPGGKKTRSIRLWFGRFLTDLQV